MFVHTKPKMLPDLEVTTTGNGRFYKLPSGRLAASVTTILGAGADKKKLLEDWRKRVGEEEANRISRVATGRGTRMHQLCEDYLNNGDNILKGSMPDAASFFNQIKPYINKINNIHYMEDALYSEKYRIAGRVDCIAEYDGVLSIIDFKTSSKTKKKEWISSYFQQTTAYSLMYEEHLGLPIDQLVVIMATESGTPQVFIESASNWKESLIEVIKDYYNQETLNNL